MTSLGKVTFAFFTGLSSTSDSSVICRSETRELSSVWGKVALSSVLGGSGTAGAAGVGRESRRDVLPRWSDEEEAEVGRSEEEEGGSITTSFRLNLIGETWIILFSWLNASDMTKSRTKVNPSHYQH